MGIIEAIKQVTREEGREEGLEEGKTEFVKKLLLNTGFSIDKISMLADVSDTFTNKVKKDLGK